MGSKLKGDISTLLLWASLFLWCLEPKLLYSPAEPQIGKEKKYFFLILNVKAPLGVGSAYSNCI